MPEGKQDNNAGPSKTEKPGKPAEARPVDQEAQKDASLEREKDGGYD